MSIRKIRKIKKGMHATDGAGVHLVRVIGYHDVKDFDPFLMLDSFDSKNPSDYTKGFPMHPHRGIETVTYLIKGIIEHEDSLGNKGAIASGQSQWMSAGNGILHQEMPQASDHLLGLQLWINLPQKDKMVNPSYIDIKEDMMKDVKVENANVRVLSGSYQGVQAIHPQYVNAQIFDVEVEANKEVLLDTRNEDNVFIFTIVDDVEIDGQHIDEKSAVLFDTGEQLKVKAKEHGARFIFFAGKPLQESISWGGPIVMNTKEELNLAFEELGNGTFIKHSASAETGR